jgi:FkbM family methyltransferase
VLRTLLQRISRGRILKRRLPAEFGGRTVYVTPEAALSLWRHDLSAVDPILFRFARELVRPGAVVWDIGANVGLFSFAAAAMAGDAGAVFSIEPDPWLVQILRRSALPSVPGHAPVNVLAVAISDAMGVVNLNIATGSRCSNFVSEFGSAMNTGRSFPVVTVTLDWLAQFLPKPSLLKIDIEGMDHLALAGAQKLLAEVRPVVIAEAETAKDRIGGVLQAHGYRLHDSNLQPTNYVSHNLVALP